MKRLILFAILTGLISLSAALPAFAQTNTYSGTLTAGPTLTGGAPDDDANSCSAPLYPGTFYYTTQQIQVPTSGTWYYFDKHNSLNVWATFYTGTFDPTNPLGGGCFANFDDAGALNLTAGVTYTVMITTFNPGDTGSYQFVISNDVYSGTVSSGPSLNPGSPNDNNVGCSKIYPGTFYYQVSQFTPSASGDFTYFDLGDYLGTGLNMWINFYDGSFDPNAPLTNCIANFNDYGVVHLNAGTVYTIVVTSDYAGDTGPFQYLLLGPGAMSGVACKYPLPTSGTAVLSIPSSPATYWAPNLQDGTNFNLPGGEHWHITDVSGDFAKVWISCQGEPVWVLKSAIVGDLSNIGATTVDLTTIGLARSSGACPYILPSDATVESLPNSVPTYFAPDLKDGTNFNIPAGHWWVVYTYGDFSEIWISCQAQPVWVLTKALGAENGGGR